MLPTHKPVMPLTENTNRKRIEIAFVTRCTPQNTATKSAFNMVHLGVYKHHLYRIS